MLHDDQVVGPPSASHREALFPVQRRHHGTIPCLVIEEFSQTPRQVMVFRLCRIQMQARRSVSPILSHIRMMLTIRLPVILLVLSMFYEYIPLRNISAGCRHAKRQPAERAQSCHVLSPALTDLKLGIHSGKSLPEAAHFHIATSLHPKDASPDTDVGLFQSCNMARSWSVTTQAS